MKYLSLIRYVIVIVSVVLILIGAYSEGGKLPGDGEFPWVGIMLQWTYIIFAIALVMTIVMSVFAVAQDPRNAKRSLFGIGLVVLVIVISWLLSDTEPIKIVGDLKPPTDFQLKLTGMELIATYIIFGGALVSILFGEVYKIVKK